MRRCLLIVVFSITALVAARAQEYKVRKSSGKIILNLSGVLVEGYGGNEIIFSSGQKETAIDPRAEGLQTINAAGYRDNTGLGISVIEKGTTVEVNEVIPDLTIKILVPRSMMLSFICHKMTKEAKVICRNMDNEIEIEAEDNDILLENITGPVTVRTLYGKVDAVFSKNIKGPVSIVSVQSTVDVAIPIDTQAHIKLKSSHSTIMASPDFKIAVEKSEDTDLLGFESLVYGKLNGGGPEFRLTSEYGKIYLRKIK